jgi:hypothetical protein
MKHRNANFRFSLCGRRCEPEEMTLVDEEVECGDCMVKLSELQFTDTKTETISKLKSVKFEEKVKLTLDNAINDAIIYN